MGGKELWSCSTCPSGKILPLFIFFGWGLLTKNGEAQGSMPKPSISSDPASGRGLQGGVITFKCDAHVHGEKTFYLFQNAKKVATRPISEPTAHFTLANLTSRHAGNYRCIYEVFRPRRRKSKPSDTLHLTILARVTEGSDLHITCVADTNHTCFFYGYGDDGYSQTYLAKGKSGTTVSVPNMTRHNMGKYVCHCFVEVSGTLAISAPSNFLELTVSDADIGLSGNAPKPNITFEPVSGTGLQGGIVVVKCEIPVDGEKIVSLIAGSEKIYVVTTLSEPAVYFTLINLSVASTRSYRCMYETLRPKKGPLSLSDEIHLTILDIQAPASVLHPSSAVVTEGSNLQVTCTANTDHHCFLYEYSDDQYSLRRQAETKSGITISMTDVTRCDEGPYVCHCIMEVNGMLAFSALSNIMNLTVTERQNDAAAEVTKKGIDHSQLLVLGFSIFFIVLILSSAILGGCLSKKDPRLQGKPTPSLLELQAF
ncbi:leukocyte immunoglobulin-like receptor subfamily B member 3A isoform X2 [Narcine bancroftii]|uniref:leukocyte immunoglobulin-like receptor subfamily B member 3A isoform X2 n=1 Tax=Narcine bancroftii TaxID=1343680 RepID=UPI003831844F